MQEKLTALYERLSHEVERKRVQTRGEKNVPERGRTEPETGASVGTECIAEHG